MRTIVVIPCRMAAQRFPGKPLATIRNKAVLHHVYDRVKQVSEITDVIVASGDEEIILYCQKNHIPYYQNQKEHASGTLRCMEVFSTGNRDYDVMINVQGDEPFIAPEAISSLLSHHQKSDASIATLVKKITEEEEIWNENVVKVVRDKDNNGIYFSRQAIPFQKSIKKEIWGKNSDFYKHIGIYSFKIECINEIQQLEPSNLENSEGLEQLNWLYNGFRITTCETDYKSIGIDTPEDLAFAEKNFEHFL